MARSHNKRGNCDKVYDRNNDYVDVCEKHEAIRGDCEECPRCPACDEERIGDLEETIDALRKEMA